MKKQLLIGAIGLLVALIPLLAAVYNISQYPNRMWMYTKKDLADYRQGKLGIVTFNFSHGTNTVDGIFGVKRVENEYVVIWKPLD